jgi:hypothetical protein
MDDDLKKLKYELAKALRGLSAEQTQLTPTNHPDKWNIQQIIQHLVLSYESTIAMFRDRLIKGVPTNRKLTAKNFFAQTLLLNLGYFPKGRQAPPLVSPSDSEPPLSGDELRAKAFGSLAEMDKILEANYRLFGRRRCTPHFVLGPLSVLQWYRFHFLHGRHHTRQIEAIRKQHRL